MECKFTNTAVDGITLAELIDTLWNVNYKKKIESIEDYGELIDTLWNVNKEGVNMNYETHERINRYIMECKFQ